jgi:FKBP-type peptidyl-prolyl cis-trans isomerase
MRTLTLITAAAFTTVALAACSTASPSGPNGATGTPQPCTASGTVSASVQVGGNFGSEPTVTFAAPLVATATERTVVIEGTGPELQPGETANISYAVYNGGNGEKIEDSYASGATQPITVDEKQVLPGIYKALNCSTVGSRVVAVIPPAEAFGNTGQADAGVESNQSVVFVIDIESIIGTRATGADQPVQPGFPTVTLNENGAPTVTIPDTAAPTEFQEAVLKKGDGPTVQEGDSVTVQYQGTVWNTKKVFDQSWGKGPTTFSTNKVVKGFSQGLVGQTVGSQVIIVIPPDLGYGAAGNDQAGISGTDTLVFVVDILGTQAATG